MYNRACDLFDVQNTFVMYSYLHRRLVNNELTQQIYNDGENFKYFLEHRIPNVFECALPGWNWIENERKFLKEQEIYFLDILIANYPYTNRDGHHMNYNPNKEYADYLYTQWKQKNES